MHTHIQTRSLRSVAVLLAVGLTAAAVVGSAAPASAAESVIAPSSYTTTSGSIATGGSVAKLRVQDQSGTADNFDRYVEFVSTGAAYSGYRQYSVPASIPPSSVSSIVVKANYRGAAAAQQAWTWALYNWSTATWTNVGTNATAASWVWKSLTFPTPSSAASHVSSTGAVRVRVSSNNRADNALLDYESITVSNGAGTVDTVAPTIPTGLTSPSKTTTSVNLAWAASTDNVGVTGYEVFANGALLASPTASSATVSNLTPGTSYSFTVKARDAAGNRSAASSALPVTTTASTAYTLPPAGGQWDYQIGGPYTPAAAVQVVSRDRMVAPAAGKYNICYVNLLQTQPDEPGQSTTNPPYGTTAWWLNNHPNVVLKDGSGNPIIDPDWNEVVFDVRTLAQRAELASVQKPWIQKCKDDGYQAIEPDNIDAEVRSSGFLKHSDVREYLKIIVPFTHSIGLAIGQKNAVGQDDTNLQWATDGPSFVTNVTPAQGFDFAIAEECGEFNECGTYVDMYGGRTYVVEYETPFWNASCAAWGSQLSVLQRDLDVRPAGTTGHIRKEC